MSPLNPVSKSGLLSLGRMFPVVVSCLLLTAPGISQSVHDESSTVTMPAPAKTMEWRSNLDVTLAEAKQQNKLVLLRFTAEWCAPCRVMDARVWPDSAVQAALTENFLIVKSDIDVEANRVIARKYGVQAVPTLIVLDSNGDEIERGGFMSLKKLVQFLETAAKAKGESDSPDGVSS